MENSWSDLAGHAPAGPVRDALEWVAAAVVAAGPLSPALLDDRLRLRIFTGRQALARLEELRRLRSPFWNVEVEATSEHAADLRFLTADDLHVRLHCEIGRHEPRHVEVLRLDWIGPEEIPLTSWEQVPDLMAHYRVRALSIASTDGSGEPTMRAWGAGQDTRFAGGSIAKPLTAVAVLALVARGVLALDDDVNDRLTSWRVPACGTWQPRVTLRALLSHSSGLPVFHGVGHEVDEPSYTVAELLSGRDPAHRPVRVELLPGLLAVYSNAGYEVVEQLVEDVTGAPLATLVEEVVLGPLGMTNTAMATVPAATLGDRMAVGHDQFGAPLPWVTPPGVACGGLITTAADLCRFARGLQHAAAGRPGAILPPELVEEMLTPEVNPCVGLGVMVSTSGRRRFGHRGGMLGYVGALTATVEPGPAVAVLVNCGGDTPLFWSAMTLAALEAAGEDLFVTQRPLTQATTRAVGVTPGPQSPRADTLPDGAEGVYRLRPGYDLTVAAGVDGPTVQVPGQEPVPLLGGDDARFALEGLAASLEFTVAGEAVLRQGEEEWRLRREPA
jgi:CubicO group peptidase (beta-lactamase class C family)